MGVKNRQQMTVAPREPPAFPLSIIRKYQLVGVQRYPLHFVLSGDRNPETEHQPAVMLKPRGHRCLSQWKGVCLERGSPTQAAVI